ncbi:unnamed protein product [Absidia cylindrospora]
MLLDVLFRSGIDIVAKYTLGRSVVLLRYLIWLLPVMISLPTTMWDRKPYILNVNGLQRRTKVKAKQKQWWTLLNILMVDSHYSHYRHHLLVRYH